jgi:hypothetical protein
MEESCNRQETICFCAIIVHAGSIPRATATEQYSLRGSGGEDPSKGVLGELYGSIADHREGCGRWCETVDGSMLVEQR